MGRPINAGPAGPLDGLSCPARWGHEDQIEEGQALPGVPWADEEERAHHCRFPTLEVHGLRPELDRRQKGPGP